MNINHGIAKTMNNYMKQILKLLFIFLALVIICMSVVPSYAMYQKTNINDGNNGFRYRCDIYKSAAIITWNQPLDSTCCIVYSKDHQRSFNTFSMGNAKNRRTFVIPLKHFEAGDFPLSAFVHFYGSNFKCSDSITINL